MSEIYLSWDEYAIKLARVAAEKSKDPWKKVGTCLLRHDNSVASLGYNGFPAGITEDWNDRDERRKYVVHSEKNALRYIKPGECYLAACTLLPCNDCLKDLSSYKIQRIVYDEIYINDSSTLILAEKFGIELVKFSDIGQKTNEIIHKKFPLEGTLKDFISRYDDDGNFIKYDKIGSTGEDYKNLDQGIDIWLCSKHGQYYWNIVSSDSQNQYRLMQSLLFNSLEKAENNMKSYLPRL